MTISQHRNLWIKLVNDKLNQEWEKSIAEKLKRIKFDRHGEMKPGRNTLYAKEKLPHLIELYNIRKQALEIPKRKMRTRLTPHSPRRNQMELYKSNQLDLF